MLVKVLQNILPYENYKSEKNNVTLFFTVLRTYKNGSS
jgi:hypothetical protein